MTRDFPAIETAKRKRRGSKMLVVIIISIVVIMLISLTIGRGIYEGRSQTLTSFSLIHFSGYLFFLLMPVEMAFVYYLTWYDEAVLIWFALVTAITAQYIDYLIGFSINSQTITRFVSEKRIVRAQKYLKKYGSLTIFIFNFLPLSSPVIALAAGFLRYNLKDLFIFSILGLLLKYIVLSQLPGWFA